MHCQHSFVSVTARTQIISATHGLVESAANAFYNGGVVAQRNLHARAGCAGARDG